MGCVKGGGFRAGPRLANNPYKDVSVDVIGSNTNQPVAASTDVGMSLGLALMGTMGPMGGSSTGVPTSIHLRQAGWVNGHCTKCNKPSTLCNCTGAPKEIAWHNGNCIRCTKQISMCSCQEGTGAAQETSWNNRLCQKCGKSSLVCGCQGIIESLIVQMFGQCVKCGQTLYTCYCQGGQKEISWSYGHCHKCSRSCTMCTC